MTPAALRALILALADDHPAKVAYLAGNDEACAAALRAKTMPGRVSTVDLAREMYEIGIYGKCEAVVSKPVPESQPGANFWALCKSTVGMLKDLPDVNTQSTAIQTGLAAFIAQGWIDQATADHVTAMSDNRVALVEGAHHLQVAEARIA